jgi:hypothetical protein
MLNQLSSEFNFDNTNNLQAVLTQALRENAADLGDPNQSVSLELWKARREAIVAYQAVFASIEKRIAFIDQELSWVSSDQVAASLESERQALVDEHFQLNYPVSR